MINSCSCIIGNSSSGIREASFLRVPSVNIGSRQNNRERGDNCISVNYKFKEIYNAVKYQLEHGRYHPSKMFGAGNAGERIVDVISKINPNIQKTLNYLDANDVRS